MLAAWAPRLAAQWRIMPIGDSITEGVGSSAGTGFRPYLYNKLQGIDFTMVGPNGASPYNAHFTRGAKIEEFYSGGYGTGSRDIASSMDTYRPDIILIHLGTNNMNNDAGSPYSTNAGISLEQNAPGKLAELLRYASQWANGTRGDFLRRIVVCKIVPRLVNGALDAKVAEYNAEIDRMFFENAPGIVFSKVTIVDMNSVVQIANLTDGVHPNDAGYSKMADEFSRVLRGVINGDTSAPGTNNWLGASALAGSTASLRWQAVGDDGSNGLANLYELRYAAFELSAANFSQGILVSLPKPAAAGNIETAAISGLVPGLTYFFGIRTWDELNNRGPVSFSPPVDMNDTTSTEYCDDFTDAAAANWNLHPAYRIDMTRGELVNGTNSSGWDYVAAYKAASYTNAVRGVRTAMTWSSLADDGGINASGIAMMLSGPSYQASGYLVRVRNRIIYLNEIINGSINTADIMRTPFPTSAADPKSGDMLEVKFNPSGTLGHSFNVYLNEAYLGDVYDTARRHGNSDRLYSGIVLYGQRANTIDAFCLEVPPLAPDTMLVTAGADKHGRVTQRLAEPLAVRIVDANNIPVSDVQVEFKVLTGEASLSTDSLDVTFNGNLWQEAEDGDLQVPYVTGNSSLASRSGYIYVPVAAGNNNRGITTYQIYIPKAGTYKLWLRGYAPDGYQNSCYFSLGTDTLQVNFSNFKTWEWVPYGKSYALSKGFIRLTIKNREAGLQLDKFLLTSNSGYVPTGTGQTTQRFSNITDGTGSAYSFISFGQTAGSVTVRASAPAVPNGSELSFNVYADALDPLEMRYASDRRLTGIAGETLERDFAVQLQDKFGNYCVGVQVEFAIKEGEGRFSGQNSIRVSSNSQGIASARFTLGFSAMESRITAALPDLPAVTPLAFEAIAGEGIPISISSISGDAQVDTVANVLSEPLVVQVLDEKGRPVLNYPVSFEIIRGSGRLNGQSSATVDSTDSNGKARVTWTLGDTAGVSNNQVRVDVPLSGAPLYFTASALPEQPALLTLISGDGQSTWAGENFPEPLAVKLSDRFGNGRAGHKVIYTVVTGSGTFAGAARGEIVTDSLGMAAAVLRTTTRTGLHQVKAEVNSALGIDPKVFASLMVQPPRATQLTHVSGVGQEGLVRTSLGQPFKVKASNPFGDPVANVTIRFKVVNGGGHLNGLDSLDLQTAASGEAQALLTLGTLAGIELQRVRVWAPGLPITPIEFSATALADAAESIEPVTDISFREIAQSTIPITVMIKDAWGNTRSGHTVTFTVVQGNGSFAGNKSTIDVVSNGGGLATTEYTMGTSVAVENIISITSVQANGLKQLSGSPVLLSGRVLAGAPHHMAQITQATGMGAKILSTLPQPFTIEVRDRYENPTLGSLIVNFAVIAGGGKIGDNTEVDRLTDATGRAFALLRVGDKSGSNNNTVRVTIQDHPEILPVDFTASTWAGDPDQLSFGGDSLWTGRILSRSSAYALVRDIVGNPVENHPLLFKVTRGGGKLTSVSSSTPRDTLTVLTNNVGLATAFWTTGSKPDTNRLQVSALYQNSPLRGSPLYFTAISAAEDPVSLARRSAAKDTGVIHQPLPRPLQVQLLDRYGNGVPNQPVTFTAMFPSTPGQQGKLYSASLADTAVSKSVSTNSEGIATVWYQLSPQLGLNHVKAEARFNGALLSGSPVDFYIEGLASPARRLVLLSEAAVTGVAGSRVTVRVRTDNSQGQPVGGQPVLFTAIDNASSLESAGTRWVTRSTRTGSGVAEAVWLLGSKAGSQVNTLEVSAGGLDGSPLTIKATVVAGVPYAAKCALSAVDSVVADNLATSLLTVTLKDSLDNPVAGKQVTFSSLDLGLTFVQPLQVTNALGQTTGSVRSNESGKKRIAVQLAGEGSREVASRTVTFLPGLPKQMLAWTASTITVNSGTAARDSLAVVITDAFGNRVPGIPVTFAISSGSGYLLESRSGSHTTQSNGLGIASIHIVAGNAAGEPVIIAATSSQPQLANIKVNFVVNIATGVPALLQKRSGDGQTGPAGSELAAPLQVWLTDGKNQAVAGVAIKFTALESGAEIVSANPVETDYRGYAAVRYRLGFRAGEPPQLISAQVVGSPLSTSFIAWATGTGAARLVALSGTPQEGIAGKMLPQPLRVRVADDFGNGVADVVVRFHIANNNGSGQQLVDSVRTDINGTAALQPSVPTLVGEYLYLATSPALPGLNAAFNCTVKPDAAWRLGKYSGDYQSMTAGRELNAPVVVMVTDQYDNRVPGETIQFATLNNSGQAVDAYATSDSRGLASCRWILAAAPKSNTLMAFKLGLRNSPLQFTALGVLNKFPEFVDRPADPLRIEYNKSFALQIKARDEDGDALKYSLKLTPPVSNAYFDSLSSQIFSWKPTVRQKGEYRLHLRVADSRGGFDIDSLTVSVVGDSAPVFTSFFPPPAQPLYMSAGTQLFTCAAVDYDNDPLTFTWYVDGVARATGARFEVSRSEFVRGTHFIWVVASDGIETVQSPVWQVTATAVELSAFTAAAEPYAGIRVAWRTTHESGNLGFDLLRGASAEGPFTRINNGLIASRDDGDYAWQDSSAAAGERYWYLLEDVSLSGARLRHGPVAAAVPLPQSFALQQNYPNPFNPSTAIRFQLPKADKVMLVIFNTLGQRVRLLLDDKMAAGYHAVQWDGRDDLGVRVGSGLYYARLVTPAEQAAIKMVLLK